MSKKNLAEQPVSRLPEIVSPAMNRSDKFPDILRTLCDSQPLAVLATASDSAPYVNLVAFAFSSNLKQFYFATPKNTRKYQNLSANSHVSLLVDNRSNEIKDFSEAAAATVMGSGRELRGLERQKCVNLYLAKHPHLNEFLAAPDCALFEVSVDKIYLVTSFQQVMEFDFSQL